MSEVIAEFERECEAAGVRPTAALVAGGVHPTQWWRWKTGKFMPGTRSLQKAKAGLASLAAEKAQAS
jgi:hypothetical protein